MSSRLYFSVLVLLGIFGITACGHKAPVKPPAPPVTNPNPPIRPPARELPPVVPPTVPPAATPGKEQPPVATPALSVRGPLVRIGLTINTEEIKISSAGTFILIERTPEAPRQKISGAVQIRFERPQAGGGELYRVQVSSLASRAAAERLGKELAERFAQPAMIRENGSNGNSQVRLGAFASRSEAQEFASGPMAGAGYRDAFVVRELGDSATGDPTLTLRGPDSLFRTSQAGYLFFPDSDADLLQINGKPYRGMLEIGLGKNGRILVINQLGMEEYLFGVIPAELDPVSFPERAALEAQAIAARTYALKNIGAKRTNGFDLTDDTTMQVYGGAAIEKQGSNAAVRNTAGIAAYYDGSLIDAMYMSTCGGHTEDFAEVFGGPPVPYLQGVFCTIETSRAGTPEANLGGSHDLSQVVFTTDGTPVNRELELSMALGLTDRLTPDVLAGIPGASEIRSWLEKSRSLAGKAGQGKTTREASAASWSGFLSYAAELFFGGDEIERTISSPDSAYYMGNFSDGSSVPESARTAIAYLAQRKLWQPYPDNSIKPDQPVSRSDALALLVRWIVAARPEILNIGVAADPNASNRDPISGNMLAINRGSRTERLRLAQDVRLFKLSGGRSLPVQKLVLIGNERLSFHQKANGEVDFLEVQLNATGAASDRLSPVASWQATVTRAAATEKLRSLAPAVGEIRDLKPAKLGRSGRVVQLELIGSSGSAVVNGYQVRNKLGLKDTLYTLTRLRADDGTIGGFTFDGRGWGHGVGLCQTGAVGMARAGRTTEEILKAYYHGIELRKAY